MKELTEYNTPLWTEVLLNKKSGKLYCFNDGHLYHHM